MEVPQLFLDFFKNLNRIVFEKKLSEVTQAYDNEYPNLLKYFANSALPPIELLESQFDVEVEFDLLYDQLQFRHIFSKKAGKLEEFNESYYMHQKLFNMILKEDLLQRLCLSKQWIWDIVDSFLFQFISYMEYIATENQKDLILPKDKNVWSPSAIFIILMELIEASNHAKIKNDFTKNLQYTMIKTFGYFSAVQSLKIHTLFGDYSFALKFVENFDIDPEVLYYMVPSCRATLYYYSAFAYMMTREYQQSIKNCLAFLSFVYNRDIILTPDMNAQVQLWEPKIKAVLAICSVLYPCRLDDNINNQLREQMGEKINRMNKGDLETYKICLRDAYPEFLPLNPDLTSSNVANVFIEEMQQCLAIPILRNYIKYYTTLPLSKLSSLMHTDQNMVKTQLLLYKQKIKEIKCSSSLEEMFPVQTESLTIAPQADFDFCIDRDDTVITFDSKVERKLGEYFIKQILKFDEISKSVKRMKNY